VTSVKPVTMGCIEILHRRKIWHALTLTLNITLNLTLNLILTLTLFCAGVAGVVFLYTGYDASLTENDSRSVQSFKFHNRKCLHFPVIHRSRLSVLFDNNPHKTFVFSRIYWIFSLVIYISHIRHFTENKCLWLRKKD